MKKNSWHYNLAKFANNSQNIYSGDLTICQYVRKVIMGGLMSLTVMLLAGAFFVWIGWALWEIVGSIFGFSELGPAAGTFMGIIGLFFGTFLWTVFQDKWKVKSKDLLNKQNTSLAASAYKSYKEKICFKVDIE